MQNSRAYYQNLRRELTNFIAKAIKRTPYNKAVIGLSGGIDSTVVAYLAVEALGKDRVLGVSLPSGTASPDLVRDAHAVARDLEIKFLEIDISPLMQVYRGLVPDNDPRRVGSKMVRERMSILYHIASMNNAAVLGTGNRSEYLLGYFSVFGDVACDINPLAWIYKTEVKKLGELLGVSQTVIDRPPTAGFWVGQTDEKEFGFSYEDADPILHLAFDKGYTKDQILRAGLNGDLVERVLARARDTEFKRNVPIIPPRPAEPGI
ncbi:MAG TPA: NAD+ synthase [Firmicutes bacterium]|nr:NAD+ synthase [Bacillota bacterium]